MLTEANWKAAVCSERRRLMLAVSAAAKGRVSKEFWGEANAPETGGRRSTCGAFVKVREVSELHVSTGQHTVEGFGVLADKDGAPRTEDMSTNTGKDGNGRQQTRAGPEKHFLQVS